MVINPNPKVNVAVIVLTMNQCEKTLRCLFSFRTLESPIFRIVLWDNGSLDGTAEAVSQAFPEVLVHRHPKNIGVASGRNAAAEIAIKQLNPAYLLFIDNDMTVTPDFLDALLKPFETDDRIGQTTGKIMNLDDSKRIYGAGGCRIRFWLGDTRHVGNGEMDCGQYDVAKKCVPSGGCMLVHTDVFQRLGGFDTIFDPYGPEDLDFGLRAAKAGFYGFYVPQAIVFHEHRPGRTFEDGQYTQNFAYQRVKHWFLFMGRHATRIQELGFLIFGIPTLLLGFINRQAKTGNPVPSLWALVRGTFDYGKSLLIRGDKLGSPISNQANTLDHHNLQDDSK